MASHSMPSRSMGFVPLMKRRNCGGSSIVPVSIFGSPSGRGLTAISRCRQRIRTRGFPIVPGAVSGPAQRRRQRVPGSVERRLLGHARLGLVDGFVVEYGQVPVRRALGEGRGGLTRGVPLLLEGRAVAGIVVEAEVAQIP